FFFQAEDGIRDFHVTGVQTCALPICPDPVTAGAVLAPEDHSAVAVVAEGIEPELPQPGDLVELPVMLGPRADWFTPAMIRHFLTQEWLVTPQSSRVGIRLQGDAITREDAAELPSEGTETGDRKS